MGSTESLQRDITVSWTCINGTMYDFSITEMTGRSHIDSMNGSSGWEMSDAIQPNLVIVRTNSTVVNPKLALRIHFDQ